MIKLAKLFFAITSYLPSGQNRQKNNLKECVYVNSALKMQCQIVKNTKMGSTQYNGSYQQDNAGKRDRHRDTTGYGDFMDS